jgi:rare lipoprotein A
VRVTNIVNGRSVIVRINDRGPYKPGRVIDLSEAAAGILDMHKVGLVPVKVQVVSN